MTLSLTSEHRISMPGREGRIDPLVLAYAVLFACLILTGLLVTLFGAPLDNTAVVRLDLAKPVANAVIPKE